WHILQRKVMTKPLNVQRGHYPRMHQNCFNLRTENEAAALFLVIEWLNPQTIACDEQPLAGGIPNGESKHAAEFLNAVLAHILVEVYDDLRIARGAKHVTPRAQCLLKFTIVIDLPVKNDRYLPCLIRDRLFPAGKVDNTEPLHAHSEV